MSKYKVTIIYDVPDTSNFEQFEEWVKYEIIRKYPCRNNNPLIDNNVSDYIYNYEIENMENKVK